MNRLFDSSRVLLARVLVLAVLVLLGGASSLVQGGPARDEINREALLDKVRACNAEVQRLEKEAGVKKTLDTGFARTEYHALAVGVSAEAFLLLRAYGHTAKTHVWLLRRNVRAVYAAQRSRARIDAALAQAEERAYQWLLEHGVELDLRDYVEELRAELKILPDEIACPELPPKKPPECPTCPECEACDAAAMCPVEKTCPTAELKPEPEVEGTSTWHRLSVDIAPMLGSSVHSDTNRFSHVAFGLRTGLWGRLWQGERVALSFGGGYVLRAHNSNHPVTVEELNPASADARDATALMIYEHSLAVGPRVRLRLGDKLGLRVGVNLGASMYRHQVEREEGSMLADVYASDHYRDINFYGEGVLGLLFARDALSLNFSLSGTAFTKERIGAADGVDLLGLGVAGFVGVDVVRVAMLAQGKS